MCEGPSYRQNVSGRIRFPACQNLKQDHLPSRADPRDGGKGSRRWWAAAHRCSEARALPMSPSEPASWARPTARNVLYTVASCGQVSMQPTRHDAGSGQHSRSAEQYR